MMENLLVVTAPRCAFALNQHFKGASEPGRNDGAQTADAYNSRPRRGSCFPGKARCVLLEISYHLKHASGNNASGEEGRKHFQPSVLSVVGELARRQRLGGRDLRGS